MKSSDSFCAARKWTLAGLLSLTLLSWVLFHAQINNELALHLFLRSQNPREDVFEELVTETKDPIGFLNRTWQTGKVVHRQFVAAYLKESATKNVPWFSRAEPLLLACVTDADASVRELGMGALAASSNPRLFDAANFQLGDFDPLVRQIGLGYLRKSEPQQAVPILIRLLDDPDLRIVTEAEVCLARWTGEDFGIRTRMAIPEAAAVRPGEIDPSVVEIIHRGVQKRKEWWKSHKDEYGSHSDSKPAFTFSTESDRAPVANFNLTNLDGKPVRLSDFRGKVVLVNFWATWCSACLAEIPDLIALQKKNTDEVTILGIALDGMPDEHDDSPDEGGHAKSHSNGSSSKVIHAKVERAVKSRQINYPVLLDSRNSVGGQYNGGELPTTIIIDKHGRLRRRFIGERNLKVFEAMIAEARSEPR
jgi:thiol-disulfide isomerase/thioredoxin